MAALTNTNLTLADWAKRVDPDGTVPIVAELLSQWTPSHFFERIVPQLREGGASEADIETMLVDNPRRLFTGA